jgi:hypothetical protein
MPLAYLTEPSLIPIKRPRCRKCQTRMNLARIMPGPKGYDYRTFECTKCDHTDTIAVCTDPMKSGSAGWMIHSNLNPPE